MPEQENTRFYLISKTRFYSPNKITKLYIKRTKYFELCITHVYVIAILINFENLILTRLVVTFCVTRILLIMNISLANPDINIYILVFKMIKHYSQIFPSSTCIVTIFILYHKRIENINLH